MHIYSVKYALGRVYTAALNYAACSVKGTLYILHCTLSS